MADRAHWPDSPPGPDRSRVLSGGGMKLSIRHDTTYSYADEVCTSIQFLRLTPKDTQRQRILQWHLELPRLVRSQLDPYGNILPVMTMEARNDDGAGKEMPVSVNP